MAQIHEMDAMGAWSTDDGTCWLPRSLYPTRTAARAFYADHCGLPRGEVQVAARWAVHAPDDPDAARFDGDYWCECPRRTPGAFPVWRCE